MGEKSLSSEMKSTEALKADQDAHLFFQAACLMVGAKEVVDIPQVAKNKQTFMEVKRVAEPFNLYGISYGNKNARTIGDNQAKGKGKEVETVDCKRYLIATEEQCDNSDTSSKPEYLCLGSEEISKKISQNNELRKRKALDFEALRDRAAKRKASNSTRSAGDDECSMLGEAEDGERIKATETVPESQVKSTIKIIDTNLDKAGGFMEASEIGSVKTVSVSDAKEQSDSLLQAKASKLNKNNTKAESTKHSCQICNREFSTHLALKSHERIHMKGQRKGKFACKICDKTFRKSANLTLHKKKDHPELKSKIKPVSHQIDVKQMKIAIS